MEELKGEHPTLGAKASRRRRKWASPWRMNRISVGGDGVGEASGKRPSKIQVCRQR